MRTLDESQLPQPAAQAAPVARPVLGQNNGGPVARPGLTARPNVPQAPRVAVPGAPPSQPLYPNPVQIGGQNPGQYVGNIGSGAPQSGKPVPGAPPSQPLYPNPVQIGGQNPGQYVGNIGSGAPQSGKPVPVAQPGAIMPGSGVNSGVQGVNAGELGTPWANTFG